MGEGRRVKGEGRRVKGRWVKGRWEMGTRRNEDREGKKKTLLSSLALIIPH